MNFRSALLIPALSTTALLALSGCSILPGSDDEHSTGDYPQTIDSPYGTTEITEAPTTIAVTSPIDLDIALSLGVTPVIAPAAEDSGDGGSSDGGSGDEVSPWAADALKDSGATTPTLYDPADGPDLAAIEKSGPDLILATGLENAGDHFDELSQVAPTVASAPEATWTDRTAAVATALDKAEEAKTVVGDVTTAAQEVADKHLEFEDTTYALADVQKTSIDYLSYDGSDDSFFTGLGLLPASAAKDYSAEDHSVKKSDIDALDADVLFIHFPDKGTGMLDESELKDPFYREVRVIRGKHYTVLDDEEFTALTNLSPLSFPWLLDEFPGDIGKAEQGVL